VIQSVDGAVSDDNHQSSKPNQQDDKQLSERR